MANSTPEAFVESLEGTEVARIMSIACFSLAVYEYMITFDEEIKYFWTGRWTTSRILFFMNRYLPPVIMILPIICFSVSNPSPGATFLLSLIAIGVIQGVLVTRIWYLFQSSKAIQIGIILGFTASLVCSMVFLYFSLNNLHIITLEEIRALLPSLQIPISQVQGCRADRPPNFWRIYLPSLVLHTFLYLLTAIKALKNRRLLKDAPILSRLLRDGGFFYFVVFVSVGFTAIGSFLKQAPRINIPAIYSPFLLTTTSVAVSRVLFSIHSLADRLGSDSAWLLNNAQLSRTGWRRGAHEGELIIERNTVDGVNDPERADSYSLAKINVLSLKETRVGVYNERSW